MSRESISSRNPLQCRFRLPCAGDAAVAIRFGLWQGGQEIVVAFGGSYGCPFCPWIQVCVSAQPVHESHFTDVQRATPRHSNSGGCPSILSVLWRGCGDSSRPFRRCSCTRTCVREPSRLFILRRWFGCSVSGIKRSMIRSCLSANSQSSDCTASAVRPMERTHYSPTERAEILQVMRLRGWTAKRIAERFVLHSNTIRNWQKAIRDKHRAERVVGAPPWNKLHEAVRWTVHEIHRLCPEREFGTRSICVEHRSVWNSDQPSIRASYFRGGDGEAESSCGSRTPSNHEQRTRSSETPSPSAPCLAHGHHRGSVCCGCVSMSSRSWTGSAGRSWRCARSSDP